jgi:hypothetical protein
MNTSRSWRVTFFGLLPRRFSDFWHECTKSITYLQEYLSENALKLTYSNIEFKKFFRGNTPGPPLKGRGGERKGREWQEGRGKGGTGRDGGGEEGKGGEGREGEENGLSGLLKLKGGNPKC